MARTIPTQEPTELVAGESWQWDRTLSDYPPSDGWALAYALRGPSDLAIAAAQSASGDYFEVRVAYAITAPVTAGAYRLIGYVTKATDRFVVFDETVVVSADPAAAVNSASHAEKTLALIKAAIEGRIPTGEESYQINGRALSKIPMRDLVRLRGIYAQMVANERSPGSLGRPLKARFGDASD